MRELIQEGKEVNEKEQSLKWPIMLNEDLLNRDMLELPTENQAKVRIS